jgi:hypothetical protein
MADGDGGGGGGGGWLGPVAVVVAIVLALGAGGSTTTSSGTTTSSSGSSTTTTSSSSTVVTSSTTTAPQPLTACPGKVVRQQTTNGITLKLYYDPQAKGVNCVTAVRNGTMPATASLRTEVRIASSLGIAWPDYAVQTGAAGAGTVNGTYLIGTDNRCVTAVATYYPNGSGGGSNSVSLNRVACG